MNIRMLIYLNGFAICTLGTVVFGQSTSRVPNEGYLVSKDTYVAQRNDKIQDIALCNAISKTLRECRSNKKANAEECYLADAKFSAYECKQPKRAADCEKAYEKYIDASKEFSKECRGEACNNAIKSCQALSQSVELPQSMQFLSGAFDQTGITGGQKCKDDRFYAKVDLRKQTKEAKERLEAAKDKYREFETQAFEKMQSNQQKIAALQNEIESAKTEGENADLELATALSSLTSETEEKRSTFLDQISEIQTELERQAGSGRDQIEAASNNRKDQLLKNCYETSLKSFQDKMKLKKAQRDIGAVYFTISEQLGHAYSGKEGAARNEMNKRLQSCLSGLGKGIDLAQIDRDFELASKQLVDQGKVLKNKVLALKQKLQSMENTSQRSQELLSTTAARKLDAAKRKYLAKTLELAQFQQTLLQSQQQDQLRKQDLTQSMAQAERVYNTLVSRGGEDSGLASAPGDAQSEEEAKKFGDQMSAFGKQEASRFNAREACCDGRDLVPTSSSMNSNLCKGGPSTGSSTRGSRGQSR